MSRVVPNVTVGVRLLPHAEGLPLPTRGSEGSAGSDLRAALSESIVLAPGQRELVATGLALAIPAGWEGQIRPRSGLAARHGITLVNSPGTIDSDYRGEVKVALINLGQEPFRLERGERIAQLVVAPVETVEFELREILSESDRGDGGFGSTGRL